MIATPTRQYDALCAALTAAFERPETSSRPLREHGDEALELPSFGHAFLDRCRMPLGRLVGLADEGVIAICSARRGEGRTSIAAALAILLARGHTGGRVLLLDLDFANASQANMHSVAPSPGLADYMEGRERLRVVAGGPDSRLCLITAGTHLGDPASLFHTLAAESLLGAFRQRFEWLVIDLPPLLGNPEAAALAAQADWPVLVGRHRWTTVADVRAARELLGAEKTASFLMTGDRTRVPGWIRRLL